MRGPNQLNRRDITGMRFGRLVALHQDGHSSDRHILWLCQCDCGTKKQVPMNSLTRPVGGTKSCGCLRRDAGTRRTKTFPAWNKGASYATGGEDKVYTQKHSWANAVIRHKGAACSSCGWDKAPCDVHHTIPKSDGGLNTIENGEVLCPNCHRVRHSV